MKPQLTITFYFKTTVFNMLFFCCFLISTIKLNADNNYIEGSFFVKIANDCSFVWQKGDAKTTQNLRNDFPEFYEILEENKILKEIHLNKMIKAICKELHSKDIKDS